MLLNGYGVASTTHYASVSIPVSSHGYIKHNLNQYILNFYSLKFTVLSNPHDPRHPYGAEIGWYVIPVDCDIDTRKACPAFTQKSSAGAHFSNVSMTQYFDYIQLRAFDSNSYGCFCCQ